MILAEESRKAKRTNMTKNKLAVARTAVVKWMIDET